MMEKILPSSRARMEVAKAIYESPGINLSRLIKKARTSPNIVLDYVNVLVKNGVIKEKKFGGRKKAHLRTFSPNFSTTLGLIVFALVESDKRTVFLERYEEFGPFAKQLDDLLSEYEMDFCVIYGSFARFSAEKDSDVDVLIVGKAKKNFQKRISEVFVTLKRNFSVKVETMEQFLIRAKNDPLHKGVLKNHAVLWNEINFVKLLKLLG